MNHFRSGRALLVNHLISIGTSEQVHDLDRESGAGL